MKTKTINILILLSCFVTSVTAQGVLTDPPEFVIVPSLQIAIFGGSALAVESNEAALFNPSININPEFDLFFPFLSELSASLRAGYKYATHFQGVDISSSTIDLSVGPRYSFFINDMWQVSLFGRAGAYYAILHEQGIFDFSGTFNAGVNAKIKVLPELGIDINAGYRADLGLSVSQIILEAGVSYQSMYTKYPQLMNFTVSKPTEQPSISWKNVFDKPVEVLGAQIKFKEKYLKAIDMKVATAAPANQVVILSILDKLTDDVFQLNVGKVVPATVIIRYKGNGQVYTKKLSIDISFKPDILKSFVQPKINEAQQNIYKYGATDSNQNKLGVVYARYGLYDEALNVFSNIVLKSEYVPALMNLGNIYSLKGDAIRAIPYLERAKAKEPYNTKVLISLAKVQMSVENFGSAKAIHDMLVAINPTLAKEYDWFKLSGDAARKAAETSKMKDLVIWAE